jgi:hypothetical protein
VQSDHDSVTGAISSHPLIMAWTIVFGLLVGRGRIYCSVCPGLLHSIVMYLSLN